jgi:hypothetical protein
MIFRTRNPLSSKIIYQEKLIYEKKKIKFRMKMKRQTLGIDMKECKE